MRMDVIISGIDDRALCHIPCYHCTRAASNTSEEEKKSLRRQRRSLRDNRPPKVLHNDLETIGAVFEPLVEGLVVKRALHHRLPEIVPVLISQHLRGRTNNDILAARSNNDIY